MLPTFGDYNIGTGKKKPDEYHRAQGHLVLPYPLRKSSKASLLIR